MPTAQCFSIAFFGTLRAVSILVLFIFFTLPAEAQKRRREDKDALASIKSREAEFAFTEAEKYFMLEDYAKALTHYQKVLDIQPDNATVHYRIADVFFRSKKPEDLQRAAASIETALRYEQKNKFFYLLGANIYMNMLRHDQAARLYENMINQIPEAREYLYELAMIYRYAGKNDEAIKTYNRAEQIFGVQENSSIPKQQLYLEMGKIKEALSEGEKLMKAFPDEERYAVGYAELLSRFNNKNQAVVVLEQFLELIPDAPQASLLLAGMYRDTQQEGKARMLIRRLFDNDEVELNGKLIILSTYIEEIRRARENQRPHQDLESFALELLQKLRKMYPDESQVLMVGADLLLSLGKTAEALETYRNIVSKGPAPYEVWNNLITQELQAGDFDAAARHSDLALEYYPNQPALYYFNGFAHFRKQRYAQAVQMLEQGKRLAGDNKTMVVDFLALLGDAYHALREHEKSDKAFEEALAINPNHEIVINNYCYYLALRNTRLEYAEKLTAQLIKRHPDNPSFLDTHAWVLYKRQKFREAKKVLEPVIVSGKANATHLEHFGDILFRLGETDEAVAYWKKARAQGGANNELLDKKIANRNLYE